MAGPMPKRTWSISALMSSADQSCTRDSQRKKLYITTDSVPFHLFKGTSLTSSDVRLRMDPSAEATTPSGAEPASGRKRGRPKSSTSPKELHTWLTYQLYIRPSFHNNNMSHSEWWWRIFGFKNAFSSITFIIPDFRNNNKKKCRWRICNKTSRKRN